MNKFRLNRRQFLIRSAIAGAIGAMPLQLMAGERLPLFIPPLLEVGRGRPVRLDFRPAQTAFEKGKLSEVWGVNGHYLAPTVRVKSGDFVKLTYVNNLPQALSVQIQGLNASSQLIGSLQNSLKPKESWSPIIPIQQKAATACYHADTPLQAAYQIYRGLVGFWLIDDENSKQSLLPKKYGVDDIPLILQDVQLNREGEQVLDLTANQFFGKQLLINGRAAAYLNVPRGWVRLRILNASLSRVYSLQLDNEMPLYLIGTGVGFFANPIELKQLQLAPSERVELLVDLSDGQKVSLISGQKRDFFYPLQQLFSSDNELNDNVILELRPEGMASLLDQKPSLPSQDLSEFELRIAKERSFEISPSERLINKQRFDPKRIDFTAQKNTVERWYLKSSEPIGFSVQGATFIIETRNRQKLENKWLAWRDVIWLEQDQEATILVKFEQAASDTQPFTFGVADFMLRDKGAMGQFSVKEAS